MKKNIIIILGIIFISIVLLNNRGAIPEDYEPKEKIDSGKSLFHGIEKDSLERVEIPKKVAEQETTDPLEDEIDPCFNNCKDNQWCVKGTCKALNFNYDEIIPVKYYGDPNIKITIVFIPLGYPPENEYRFRGDVKDHVENGFYQFEPFKSNREKINFYRVDNFSGRGDFLFAQEIVPPSSFEIYGVIGLKWGDSLSKPLLGSNPETPFGIAVSSRIQPEEIYPQQTVHEFLHLMQYGDEYTFNAEGYSIKNGTRVPLPNNDVEGCPKWCSGEWDRRAFDSAKKECSQISEEEACTFFKTTTDPQFYCSWYEGGIDGINCIVYTDIYQTYDFGNDCIEGTGCYLNGGGIYSWGPSPAGYSCLMRNIPAPSLCPIAENYVSNILEDFN